MWTDENRGRYDRSRLRYPSDLTDTEWSLTKRLLICNDLKGRRSPPRRWPNLKKSAPDRASPTKTYYPRTGFSLCCSYATTPRFTSSRSQYRAGTCMDFHRPACISPATSAPAATRCWAMSRRREWPDMRATAASNSPASEPAV